MFKMYTVLLVYFCCFFQVISAWDYIVFAQAWSQGLCRDLKNNKASTNCNIPLNDHWTVHGIWPSNRNYQYEVCSGGENYQSSQLQSIQNDLKLYWPSIFGSNHGFWKHEWNKHGRCGDNTPGLDSMVGYFGKGLEWNKQYDIARILRHSGIQPNNHKLVDVSKIADVIRSVTGGTPKIRCKNKELLTEIFVCFDNNLRIMNCYGQSNCNKQVYYLQTWEHISKGDNNNDVEEETTQKPSSAVNIAFWFFLGCLPLIPLLLNSF